MHDNWSRMCSESTKKNKRTHFCIYFDQKFVQKYDCQSVQPSEIDYLFLHITSGAKYSGKTPFLFVVLQDVFKYKKTNMCTSAQKWRKTISDRITVFVSHMKCHNSDTITDICCCMKHNYHASFQKYFIHLHLRATKILAQLQCILYQSECQCNIGYA